MITPLVDDRLATKDDLADLATKAEPRQSRLEAMRRLVAEALDRPPRDPFLSFLPGVICALRSQVHGQVRHS